MILPLVLAVDFMNFDYADMPCSRNVPPPALIRKGSLSAGTRAAVVVLACQFPMGGTAGAYAYEIRGDTAALLGRVASADWALRGFVQGH